MYLLALKLGIIRGTIPQDRAETLLREVRALPDLVQATLDRGELVVPVADRFAGNDSSPPSGATSACRSPSRARSS